ncbi:MAG: hypothetical protein EBR82_21975 [Caulobacteraceae bacterium]|nr:hypothetical protein [Caulobacteraceae bacterium]
MTPHERSLKNIYSLETDFAKRVLDWYEECIESGINILIYCGFRSNDEQNELYKIGREKSGKIVTNARGGQSFHNYGRAIDFVPLKNEKPDWNDAKTYKKAHDIASKYNLRAVSWEAPHLEDGNYPSWRSLLSEFPTQVRELTAQPISTPQKKQARKAGGRGLR